MACLQKATIYRARLFGPCRPNLCASGIWRLPIRAGFARAFAGVPRLAAWALNAEKMGDFAPRLTAALETLKASQVAR